MTATVPAPPSRTPTAPATAPGGQMVPATPGTVAPRKVATSAQRVMRICLVSVIVSLLVAVLGFAAAQNQAAGMDRATAGADRVLTVMAVRSALLEADGAATNAFLVGGLEPQDRREVYDAAVAEAAGLLTELAGGADADADLIAELNVDLATYTSLVEAARVNNRQGFPVGAAYLDQASTLVREGMLTDLDQVLVIAADEAAADFGATNRAIAVVVVLVVALGVLIVCQVRLASMTRRRLNPGLALATVLMIVAFVAGGVTAASAGLSAAQTRTESYRPTLAIAQAGVLAAEARTLESFTLIKRGSGQAYEDQFVERTTEAMSLLEGQDRGDLVDLLQTWLDEHTEIRALDDGGQWEDAVDLATTDADDGPSAAYAAFVEANDAAVAEGSTEVSDALSGDAGRARVASWVLAVTGLLAAFACWRGTAARREEYR